MQTATATETRAKTNTYSLRARKSVIFDRDYSPEPPARKKQKLTPKKDGTPRKPRQTAAAAGTAGPKFAVPAIEDPYYTALKSGKSTNALVEKWMKEYEESPDQAIVQFLQLIIASCGCSGKLDAQMVHQQDWKQTIIPHLSEYFEEDSADYPIMLAPLHWRKFRTNFGDYLTLFIIRCKNNILFDVTLMDSLIQMLTGLSESPIRAFRHTATFAAMKISSAIVDVVVELNELREKNTVQIDTEKAKLAQLGTNDRLENLLQAKQELDSKIEELTSMVQYMFKSIFVHRYRDIVPDIRTICITELGNWIRIYPALFLDDSYLKYIGWSLFDKLSDVRLKCVSALLPLYENFDLIGRLELFTNKFKERLASMAMDSEVEVATKACQLLTLIYRAFPALLTPNDCMPLYEMVYCNNRQLAVAAGEFVKIKLFAPQFDQTANTSATVSVSALGDSRQLIKDLVTFYIEGQVHMHPSYLVDSLIDICRMLKDWPTMVDILLTDEFDQNDSELIAIMCAAVKQAATGEHPPNRIVVSNRRGPGAGTEKKDLRLLQEERVRISEVFIPVLPRLLNKFIADQEKVSNLIEIFLHFELEIYPAGRQEQPLNELMVLIERIVEQYSDDEIMVKIARIFQFMTTNMAVANLTQTARVKIVDGVANNLQQLLQPFMTDGENLDEEDEAALLSGYRKLVAFNTTIDIPARWDLWDMTMTLLEDPQGLQSIDLAEKTLLLCFQTLTWEMKRVLQDPSDEAIERLRKRRDQYIKQTRTTISEAATGVENAFMCLCDTLVMFNWKLAQDLGEDNPLRVLAVKPDRDLTHKINNFVVDNVFMQENDGDAMDEHSQIQYMMKRRNILTQYCKLFMYGIFPIIEINAILKYFTKYYLDFGDIMKHLLQKCRELDKATTATAIVKALKGSYEELKYDTTGTLVDQDSEQFQALRELAKKFALSFGVDNIKNREALAMIHHDGIKYALQLDQPELRGRRRESVEQQKFENFAFFEVLQEFSPKLHRQDKLAVLKYLDKNCPQEKVNTEQHDIWQTFQLYRSSLNKAEG